MVLTLQPTPDNAIRPRHVGYLPVKAVGECMAQYDAIHVGFVETCGTVGYRFKMHDIERDVEPPELVTYAADPNPELQGRVRNARQVRHIPCDVA